MQPTVRLVTDFAFGRPLVDNSFRGVLAEAVVRMALDSDWRWCSEAWGGWDFEHEDGTRLEVKQSAARQSWAPPPSSVRQPSFDIRARTGHWVGSEWIEGSGRKAHLYIFAYHPRTDDGADHRDPLQWTFSVVEAKELPDRKTIGFRPLAALRPFIAFDALGQAVECVRRSRSPE